MYCECNGEINVTLLINRFVYYWVNESLGHLLVLRMLQNASHSGGLLGWQGLHLVARERCNSNWEYVGAQLWNAECAGVEEGNSFMVDEGEDATVAADLAEKVVLAWREGVLGKHWKKSPVSEMRKRLQLFLF